MTVSSLVLLASLAVVLPATASADDFWYSRESAGQERESFDDRSDRGRPDEPPGEARGLQAEIADFDCQPECRPRWTFAADGRALFRNAADSRTLVTNGIGRQLLNTSDLDFDCEPAFRFTLSRRLGACWGLEVVYSQADAFGSSQTVRAPGPVVFDAPNFQATASGPTGMNFAYNSRIYSTEVNLRRQMSPAVSLIGGFRWIELSEEFSGSFVTVQAMDPFWITDANNHLYGFQLGAEAKIWDRGGPLTVLGAGKAGIYGDLADQTSESPRVRQTLSARRSHTAFVGEFDVTALYRVNRHVALRAGYEVLWLTSVALAPEQIDATDFGLEVAGLNTGGDALYHGFFAGVQANW